VSGDAIRPPSKGKNTASSKKLSPKDASRSRPSKPKVKIAGTRIAATKPQSTSRQKPRKRHTHGHYVSSQHDSRHRSHKSKGTSASATRLYSDRVSSRTRTQKQRRDLKPQARSKASKNSTVSQRTLPPRHDTQKQPRSTSYDVTDAYHSNSSRLRIDCLICAESKTARHFPTRPPTAVCTHNPQTCTHCLRQWIQSEFEGKVWDQIDCPECRERMQFEDIRQFAPSAIFRRYVTYRHSSLVPRLTKISLQIRAPVYKSCP
jgi:hypothetical protein